MVLGFGFKRGSILYTKNMHICVCAFVFGGQAVNVKECYVPRSFGSSVCYVQGLVLGER